MKKLHKNVYYQTTTDGLNVGCVVTEDGAVSIDLPQHPDEALQWRDQIKEMTPKPLRAIIFTSANRVNSDALKALAPNLGPYSLPAIIQDAGFNQLYSALEAAQPRLLEPLSPAQLREHTVLPEVTFSDAMTFTLGNENPLYIDVVSGGGYIPGGSTITIRDTGIEFSGWLVTSHEPPTIGSDANVDAWITALGTLRRNHKVKTIVPARGAICDLQNVVDTVEYLKALRSDIRKLVRTHRSRESIMMMVPDLLAHYNGSKSKAHLRGAAATAHEAEFTQRIQSSLECLFDNLTTRALDEALSE
jgi:hypothetical protein